MGASVALLAAHEMPNQVSGTALVAGRVADPFTSSTSPSTAQLRCPAGALTVSSLGLDERAALTPQVAAFVKRSIADLASQASLLSSIRDVRPQVFVRAGHWPRGNTRSDSYRPQ